MNPKVIQNVNEHLQKESLSIQKVDLNKIQDAKNLLKEGNRELAIIEKNGEEANRLLNLVGRVGDDFLRSSYSEAEDLIIQIERAAKDFGVPVPNEVNQLKKMMDTGLQYRKRYSF
jgi:hypothetical protein